MNYGFGDILWGDFPCNDCQQKQHPALVVADPLPDGAVLAVVGTSKRVGRASAGGQVVVAPRGATLQQWASTGLREATGFDILGGRLVQLTPPRGGSAGAYREDKIGTLGKRSQWVWEARAAFAYALAHRRTF